MKIQSIVKWTAFVLIIVGALNWGLVGAFHFNAVAVLFGEASMVTRIIYVLVGVAGLVKLYFVAKK